ncbi:M61 family metallopeptidase [Pseudoflavitalea sp. G-6-1-2]|uniref:M61 family metallopeptidase n=1 Tax=Pseudoflavitalea sp. G-6-1-2 TaxID=2728841 RepID=UPI00146ECA0A|nr:PDZ domain-containing protein [Pseudoflavitalea sp. G-6-1-2]NML21094.1 M61 family metallopeptidase [Pseudoflavitalea sp. G-6-1-2]
MRKFSLLILLVLMMGPGFAQKISYIVSFPNITHHEASISMTVTDVKERNAIFRMSRSSPGRYATHEFGKNVYDVKAFSQNGKELTVTRIDGDVYQVNGHSGFIRLEYTLYANFPDGTYAGIDGSSVQLNIPATFMWIKGYDKSPIDVKFNIPQGKNWTIATQLKPTQDPTLFSAPGLQYFMDSPVKIGELIWKEWKQKNPNGKEYTIRLALEAKASDSLATSFAGKIRKITEQAQAVFGELPEFDYGTYTFIASINPWVDGDGMEHRNSTMIAIPVEFDGSNNLLGVFAHEFFHCWNVERIRPKTLEPFNFEKSNMSNELWFAEGFTQYYGNLLMERSGNMAEEKYYPILGGHASTKMVSPGAQRFSPITMSQHAVFVDAGTSVDKNNYANVYTSYYPYGASVAMALELELRIRFKLTLDNYMAAVWKKFAKPEVAYTIPGLEDVLASLTKDKAFAADFFKKYIYGHEYLDYTPLLAKAGLALKKANPGKAWIGNVGWNEEKGLKIESNTVLGTPLYNAGLDIDDLIISIDGKPVKKEEELKAILAAHKPGEELGIEYEHRSQKVSTKIILAESPALTLVSFEKEGKTAGTAELEFRKQWLGAQPVK